MVSHLRATALMCKNRDTTMGNRRLMAFIWKRDLTKNVGSEIGTHTIVVGSCRLEERRDQHKTHYWEESYLFHESFFVVGLVFLFFLKFSWKKDCTNTKKSLFVWVKHRWKERERAVCQFAGVMAMTGGCIWRLEQWGRTFGWESLRQPQSNPGHLLHSELWRPLRGVSRLTIW